MKQEGKMMTAKRILAVDDEPDVLAMVRLALQCEGYEVTTAGNGEDALEEAASQTPDLIILDIMMPGLSGFDVLDRLRGDAATQLTPVVMLTADGQREHIRRALDEGVAQYIVKPFSVNELLTAVGEALSDDAVDMFSI